MNAGTRSTSRTTTQIDLSMGYDVNDNLSLSFEGLNLTERGHAHARPLDAAGVDVEEQGPRYASERVSSSDEHSALEGAKERKGR